MPENVADTTETADATETTETTDTTETSTETETPETEDVGITIEDLLATDLEGDDFKGGHKGLNYGEILAGLPEDARRLIGNLRASYSTKTAEIAEQRRQLEELKKSALVKRRALLTGDGINAIDTAARRDLKAEKDWDPWSEAGIEALAEKKAAEMLQKYIKPMQEQYQVQQYRSELESFKVEHPDLMSDADLKGKVVELMKADPNLRLQPAYWQARGMLGSVRSDARRESEEIERQKKRAVLNGVRTGRRGGGNKPVGKMSGWEAYQHAKKMQEQGGT